MSRSTDPIAVIADVHGNRWALEAVLADIDARGIGTIWNLGDSLYGPLAPARTADLLIERDIPTVRGNEDRILVDPPRDPGRHASLEFTLGRLSVRHLRWLAALPPTLLIDDLLLCHGTPDSDTEYLLHVVDPLGARPRSPDEIQAALPFVDEGVILCAHDHLPGAVDLPDGRLVANPGSVGLPAYTDDEPHPHAMEAGSPHARYGILTHSHRGWAMEPVAVEYDWSRPAIHALANQRADWAAWLHRGRV